MFALQNIISFFRQGDGNTANIARASLDGAAVLQRPPPPPAPPAVAPPPPQPEAAPLAAAAKREELRAEVAGYARLTAADFDGDNGRAPAQIDIENALAFIPHIPDRAARTVYACAVGDGEICFCWQNHPEKQFFTVSFDDGGEMCFYGDLPGEDVLSEIIKYDKTAPPPAELRRLLSALPF